MSRRRLLVTAVVIGAFVGALGIGAAPTGALAARSPGQATRAAAVAQASATPAPGWGCPFVTSDGTFDLDAMHGRMDQVHGAGAFEQMWSWMTGGPTTARPPRRLLARARVWAGTAGRWAAGSPDRRSRRCVRCWPNVIPAL